MTDQDRMVYVVDDDQSMREALQRLLESVDQPATCFASAADFLDFERPDAAACLVLDVRMPGPSGLEFQRELQARDIRIPIVFISGHGDIPMSVRAMKDGAIEFLAKPFREQDLLDAIDKGLKLDVISRADAAQKASLLARVAMLSVGEREVMKRVVAGQANKVIADALGLSEITVKVRRGSVMRKMGADSLAQLVRLAIAVGFS